MGPGGRASAGDHGEPQEEEPQEPSNHEEEEPFPQFHGPWCPGDGTTGHSLRAYQASWKWPLCTGLGAGRCPARPPTVTWNCVWPALVFVKRPVRKTSAKECRPLMQASHIVTHDQWSLLPHSQPRDRAGTPGAASVCFLSPRSFSSGPPGSVFSLETWACSQETADILVPWSHPGLSLDLVGPPGWSFGSHRARSWLVGSLASAGKPSPRNEEQAVSWAQAECRGLCSPLAPGPGLRDFLNRGG